MGAGIQAWGMRLNLALMLLPLASVAWALTPGHVPGGADHVFYTFACSGILFSAAIIVAYREYRWLLYAWLSLLLLLNVAAVDGTLAYYLGGGDFVLWVVPYLLTSGSAAFGFVTVALGLDTPHRLARLRRTFLVLALVAALFPLSSFLWLQRIPLTAMWVPVNVLFFGMLLAQVLPPLTWHTPDRLQRLLTRAFPVVLAGLATAVYLAHFLSAGYTHAQLNSLNRLLVLAFAGFSLAIVIRQAVANTREKVAAERRALEAARQEAEMKLALARAEQDYAEALSVASRHRSRLARVSHDLKQPIAALRLAADRMQYAGRDAGAGRLSRAVDYIAGLAQAYVADDAGTEGAAGGPGTPGHDGREAIDTDVFARTLRQMFADQAAQRGVRLRVVCPRNSVLVEPLTAMRIMTNLVSNALQHAAPRRLLVGFRGRGDSVLFQVHDDGCGMDAEALATARRPGVRGEHSAGQGLGLGIVEELCRAQGMPFVLRSSPGRGTSACVALARGEPPVQGP